MYNYDSFTAFAAGFQRQREADSKTMRLSIRPWATAVTNLTPWSFHVFAEDTWKVMPGLTVNAGVRWEKARLPQPTEPNAGTIISGFIPSPNTDFSPRFGIAYHAG